MKEKTLVHNVVYDGKIIQVDVDEVELCDGSTSKREVVHNNGGVCVLALDENEQVILVKQYRYPSDEILYELAGGKQETGESYIESGLRELVEETGYVSDDYEYLGYLYPTVAYSTEVIHMVLARNCVYKKKCLDTGEFADTIILPMDNILEMIDNNEIKDGKTIVAVLKYLQFNQKKKL